MSSSECSTLVPDQGDDAQLDSLLRHHPLESLFEREQGCVDSIL